MPGMARQRRPAWGRLVAQCILLTTCLVVIAAALGAHARFAKPALRRSNRRGLLDQGRAVDAYLRQLQRDHSWASGVELAHNLTSSSNEALVAAYRAQLTALLEQPSLRWVGAARQRFCGCLAGGTGGTVPNPPRVSQSEAPRDQPCV